MENSHLKFNGQFNGGKIVMFTEVANLMEGAWSCY